MKTITVKVKVNGFEYRAEHSPLGKVSISWRPFGGAWEWVGSGIWHGKITGCSADIGEDVYAALDAALRAANS